MDKYFKMEVGAMLILVKDGKVLLSKRINTGYEDDRYAFVGGHLDGGETAKQALIREAKEEAGITLTESDLSYVCVGHLNTAGNRELILYYFKAENYNGNIVNAEPNKCESLNFYDINNLPALSLETDKMAINCLKTGKTFFEYGFKN